MSEEAGVLEFEDWKSAGSALVKSWYREIAQLVDERLGAALRAEKREVILDFRDGGILVRKQSDSDEAISIPRGDDGELPSRLADAVASLEAPKDVLLCLPAAEVLRLSVNLPSVKHAQLKGALRRRRQHENSLHRLQHDRDDHPGRDRRRFCL